MAVIRKKIPRRNKEGRNIRPISRERGQLLTASFALLPAADRHTFSSFGPPGRSMVLLQASSSSQTLLLPAIRSDH
eukprot:2625620-Prymnesium_polylepis.1